MREVRRFPNADWAGYHTDASLTGPSALGNAKLGKIESAIYLCSSGLSVCSSPSLQPSLFRYRRQHPTQYCFVAPLLSQYSGFIVFLLLSHQHEALAVSSRPLCRRRHCHCCSSHREKGARHYRWYFNSSLLETAKNSSNIIYQLTFSTMLSPSSISRTSFTVKV